MANAEEAQQVQVVNKIVEEFIPQLDKMPIDERRGTIYIVYRLLNHSVEETLLAIAEYLREPKYRTAGQLHKATLEDETYIQVIKTAGLNVDEERNELMVAFHPF